MKTETTVDDKFLDEAANKGTVNVDQPGRALDLEEPLSLITESVFARYISSLKALSCCRIRYSPARKRNRQATKRNLSRSASRAVSWQDRLPMRRASAATRRVDEYHWDLNTARLLRFFRCGLYHSPLSSCRKSPMLTQKTLVLPICC